MALQPVGELAEQHVAGARLRLVGEAVKAQHVEQVDRHQGDPDDGHHAQVAGDEAEVGHLHPVAQPEALERDLFREREEVGAAGLKAVAGARGTAPSAVRARRLLLEEAGEAAPDELVRQALLARAGRAGGTQGGGVGLTDVGGVEPGAAHGRREVAAEAAAHVAEVEAVVPGVEAVRQASVEAREACLKPAPEATCRAGSCVAEAAAAASASSPAAASAEASRQRRTLCRKACTRVT